MPVVSRGDKFVFAQSLAKVAEFIGLDEQVKPKLSPAELAARADLVLSAAQRFVRQIPADQFERKLPNRDRSYRELAHHLFRIPEAFVEAMAADIELVHASLVQPPPASMTRPEQVAAYGETVRQALADWWRAQPDRSGTRVVKTYWGPQSLHEVLERTTWHSCQHVRQVMMILETLGIPPDQPLTQADLAGLPLPEKVWDE